MNPVQTKSFRALMVTQFFGAFIDNMLKFLITMLIFRWVNDKDMQEQLVSLTGAVFVAPFLIFSMIAGRVADRSSKRSVTVGTSIWELVVVAASAYGFWIKSIPFLLGALFLLAMQSTFFSPAKYGVLPELMGEDEISQANGWLNIGTFAAIISGTIAATLTSTNLVAGVLVMLVASLIEVGTSFLIQPLSAANPSSVFAWNPARDLIANWRMMRQDQSLWYSALFVNYFWFLAALLQLNTFLYANQMMHVSSQVAGALLVPAVFGIGLGSYLSGRFSKQHIELGFVPWGAVGMTIFGLDLVWAYDSMIRVAVDLFLLGISGGFFEIPLVSTVQWRSPGTERGRILSTINFMTFAAVFLASVLLWVLNTPLRLNPAQVFLVLGLFSIGCTVLLWTTFAEARRRAISLLTPATPSPL